MKRAKSGNRERGRINGQVEVGWETKKEKAERKGDRPHTHFEKSAPVVQVELRDGRMSG